MSYDRAVEPWDIGTSAVQRDSREACRLRRDLPAAHSDGHGALTSELTERSQSQLDQH